jgi:hypothetical protein
VVILTTTSCKEQTGRNSPSEQGPQRQTGRPVGGAGFSGLGNWIGRRWWRLSYRGTAIGAGGIVAWPSASEILPAGAACLMAVRSLVDVILLFAYRVDSPRARGIVTGFPAGLGIRVVLGDSLAVICSALFAFLPHGDLCHI